eukprot:TRINITY_DN1289_c0_g1_i1.p1 TRINITY_DN1289_c0_g1~~TRINITY_DN1289_c0_g1_i1.p1  ORF type:complete len:432 (+),score=83.74 TRINITY_DN1289_c0_g1_i1:58-1353(+)
MGKSKYVIGGGPPRPWYHSLFLQIMIRLKYLLVTYGGLHAFFGPMAGYPSPLRPKGMPTVDYWASIYFRICWAVSGFLRQSPITAILGILTGILPLLNLGHRWVMSTQVRKFEASGYDWSKRKVKVPEFDWQKRTPEEFYEEFGKHPHPVVMRGFLNQNKALMEKFTFDKLVEVYGEENVFLSKPQGDGIPGKLKEVMDPNNYLHNSEALFKRYPEIHDLFEFERLEPYLQKKVGYCQIFIGLKGTGAPFHCAPVWNFFYMLDGRKRWYFVDQYDSCLFYPLWTFGRAAGVSLIIYPDDYSESACGEFKYCPYYETEIGPGDILFQCPWWWHGVRNTTEKTVGVASRWHPGGIGGINWMMTEEDYNICPFASWVFLAGFYSYYFMHQILKEPSPTFDEHATLRESNNRFTANQKRLSRDPGICHFGYRWRF